MRRLFTSIVFILSFASAWAQDKPLSQLLDDIDKAIIQSPNYVAQYERRITKARHDYGSVHTDAQRFDAAYALYDLYRPFVNDSAVYFLKECIALADKTGQTSDKARCQALLAWRCSSTGMYEEALNILASIRTEGIDRQAMGEYAHAYNNVYNEMAYYTQIPELKQTYSEKADQYQTLMYETLPPTDPRILLRREMTYLNNGHFKESMQVSDEWLKMVKPGSHPYAMVALYRYLEYKARDNEPKMMYWLVESVLADIRNGVLDQGSMWELANQLMLMGDVEHANRYIIYTSDCAIRYGSRQRNWQIAPLMNQIAKNYKEKSDRNTRQLRWLLALISILALIILGALFYVRSRNRQLRTTRNALREKNKELSDVNQQLTDANAQQSLLNTRLKTLNEELVQSNARLAETNRVKEEYIGRFLRLCSMYIDQMDSLRKRVNKLTKNRQFEELYKITRPQEFKDKELEELYVNFDSAFLHLFPNFVSDFNSLLRPEERIDQPLKGRLPTVVRIFALIRLGIEDSGKIAEFLHYSVNTIYNYRARVKNGAISDRENFEKHVKEL